MSKVIKNYKKIKYGPALEDDKDVLEWINNIRSNKYNQERLGAI